MTTPRPRGRPKQNGEKRRNEILTEAVEVFSRDGYRSADLQEIADNLGIAKGTRRHICAYSQKTPSVLRL
jgi:AcrR family transcriptional regulator